MNTNEKKKRVEEEEGGSEYLDSVVPEKWMVQSGLLVAVDTVDDIAIGALQ